MAPEETAVRATGRPAQTQAPVSEYVSHRQWFSSSLLERSSTERRRRLGTTIFSVSVQTMLVLVLILLPLWFTDTLPMQQLVTFLAAPPPPPAPPPPAAAPLKAVKVVSQVMNGQLLAPNKIPRTVKMIKEEEAPPQAFGVTGGVVGGVPGGQSGGVIGSLISSTNQPPQQVIEPPKRVRISQGVSVGLLENSVEPKYPLIAIRARVQGTVRLGAVIAKDGHIENLQLIEGHPLLVEAAMNAVRQWHYRPYTLSGEPVEVETTVIVNFHLDR